MDTVLKGVQYWEGHGIGGGGALYWEEALYWGEGHCIGGTVLGRALYWYGHFIGRGTVLGGELYWGDCIARDTVL